MSHRLPPAALEESTSSATDGGDRALPRLDDGDLLPTEGGCPACRSTRMTFRIRPTAGAHEAHPRRTLVWECGACGLRWAEALLGPTSAPVDAPWAPGRLVS